MKIKEQIKQRIKIERGEYGRARKKKFLYLKHTGQLESYYKQKQGRTIPKPIIKAVKISLWERIIHWFKNLLYKGRNRFQIKKEQPIMYAEE